MVSLVSLVLGFLGFSGFSGFSGSSYGPSVQCQHLFTVSDPPVSTARAVTKTAALMPCHITGSLPSVNRIRHREGFLYPRRSWVANPDNRIVSSWLTLDYCLGSSRQGHAMTGIPLLLSRGGGGGGGSGGCCALPLTSFKFQRMHSRSRDSCLPSGL